MELIDLRNVEAKSTSGINMEESTSPPRVELISIVELIRRASRILVKVRRPRFLL